MEKDEEKAMVKKKKTRKFTKESWCLLAMIVVIILLDQAFKIWVQNVETIAIVPGFLEFKVSQNTSAAYGIGSNSKFMYVATNVVILGVIYKFLTTQNEFVDTKLKVFLSFILAGGISNVIDKLVRGYVTEFIDFGHHFPVFNVADFFVVVGWVTIAAIFASFTIKEWRGKKEEKE